MMYQKKIYPKVKIVKLVISNNLVNKNVLTTSLNSNVFNRSLKPNYKSTPMIKNTNLNLINDIVEAEEKKEIKNNEKNIEISTNYNSHQNLANSLTKKLTPKNTSIPKNMHFNLWRKPVVLGGGLQIQPNSETFNIKSSLNKQKANNLKSSQVFNNQTKDTTNILSTNNTDNKKDNEINTEYFYNFKNNSPNISSPKNCNNKFKMNTSEKPQPPSPRRTNTKIEKESKIKNNYQNIYNSKSTNNDNIQSEILSSIINFQSLLKSNQNTNNIEKLFKSQEDMTKIQDLNTRLNKYPMRDKMSFHSCVFRDSKNLLDENDIIRRDTFIETNNKHINVINADMLEEHASRTKTEEHEIQDKKSKIMNEIVLDSDLRMKRYEILLDFINTNLKEINQMMTGNNQDTHRHNTLIHGQDDMNRIDEVNSNKLSSLHSKINLNSKFNIEEECSSQFKKENLNKFREPSQTLINLDINPNDSHFLNNFKNNPELCPSFLISSINSEFYQNLLEESENAQNNELSQIKSKKIPYKKIDRMLSYESDKTPLQYSSKQSCIVKKSSDGENLSECGEENLQDSDLDRTKENIIANDPRKICYNQVVKDMERVKLFV